MQLEITPKAEKQLLEAMDGDNDYLRLAVQPGGCAGMSYAMVLDDKLSEGDSIIFEKESLRVIADTESAKFLDGIHIDYSDDLVESGFRISNPNAQKSCGCGSSFGC